ncbi:hypothetical protein RQP52_23180 [Paenibacillus sp. PFR10]|uniref:Helix-turn-helix domain-containing protein n=2 Tax=Paenibacillus TaxID=44249 RepID=A0ABU3RIC3_9BACL|nr:hypothetical protein [Paenibacillus sp. PFR10]MDU0203992.1 hypothetical protein [Paenibacillus sp. PFR10]
MIDKGLIRRDFSVFKKSPELLSERKFIRKEEIRTKERMSYEKLIQLSEFNEIQMIKIKKGKRKQYFVERNSFDKKLEDEKYYITKSEAALMLGIQKDSIPKLITAGILKTYHKKSNRYELLNYDEVKRLLERCRGELGSDIEKGYIRFHEALITYSVCGLSIVKLIKFTLNDELKPMNDCIQGTLSQNYYKIDELQKCIDLIKKENQSEQGYYLQDVIDQLNIGEKKARQWMKEGILVPDQIIEMKDGRKRYLFNKKRIDNLLLMKNERLEIA